MRFNSRVGLFGVMGLLPLVLGPTCGQESPLPSPQSPGQQEPPSGDPDANNGGSFGFLQDSDLNEFNQNARFHRHLTAGDSDVSLQTGNLVVRHKCVTYRSLGLERGIELVYSAEAANPKPIIPTSLQAPNVANGIYDTTLTIRKFDGTPVFPDIPGELKIDTDEPVRHTSIFDAVSLTTGVYAYTLEFANRLANEQHAAQGFVIVRNDLDSPVGAGWSIAEIEQLYPTDDGSTLLIAHGNGSNIVFTQNGPTTAPVDLCRIFDCENGILGGTFDPCLTPTPLFVDCPSLKSRIAKDRHMVLEQAVPANGSGQSRTPGDFSTMLREGSGTWKRVFKNGDTHHFDASGQITAKQDANGNETLYQFEEGHLIRITDPVGREVRMEYEGNFLKRIIDPMQRKTEFVHDPDGNLVKIIDPDNSEHLFEYDGHVMVAETDKAGNKTQYKFNATDGRLERTIFADGATREIFPSKVIGLRPEIPGMFTSSGQVEAPKGVEARYRDATGNLFTVRTDRFGRVVYVKDPSGSIKRWTRDDDGLPTEYVDALEHQTSFKYDDRGNLEKLIDPLHYITLREYDEKLNLLTHVNDANGRNWYFHYDENGNVLSFIDAASKKATFPNYLHGLRTTAIDRNGHKTGWTYDDRGLVLTRTIDGPLDIDSGFDAGFGNGKVIAAKLLQLKTTYAYNEAGFPIRITNSKGVVTEFEYDAMNRIISSTIDPDGLALVTLYSYERDGLLKSTTAPDGATTQYRYDSRRRLVEVIDPEGGSTRNEYDAEGRPTAVIDPEGRTTKYDYDLSARIVRITNPLGGVREREFDAGYNVIRDTDERGVVTSYEYDKLDRPTRRIVDPDGLSLATELTYPTDPAPGSIPNYPNKGSLDGRRPHSVVDAMGRITEFSYDELDRLIAVTRRANESEPIETRYEWDPESNLLQVIDAVGTLTTYSYDGAYRLISRVLDPGSLSQETTFAYDGVDNLVETVTPNGNRIVHTYDTANRRIKTTDSIGLVTERSFDKAGRITKTVDGDGRTHEFRFDRLGRLVADVDGLALAESYTYDKVGNRLSVTDRNGNTSTFAYDHLNRVTQESHPLGLVTQFEFDPVGNRTAIVDANAGRTAFNYDAASRLTQQTFADGGTQTFSYDLSGNLIERVHQDGTSIHFGYDDLNRQISRTYADGNDSYDYDRMGRMTNASNAVASVQTTYDAAGRPSTIQQDDQTVTFSYALTADRNERAIAYPSGLQIQEIYDKRNRLLSIRESGNSKEVATFAYNLANRKTKASLANGVKSSWNYDANLRLAAVGHQLSDQLLQDRFVYDRVGNLVAVQRANDLEDSLIATYDALNRLVDFRRGRIQVDTGSAVLLKPSSLSKLIQTQRWLVLDPLGNWKSIQSVVEGKANTQLRSINSVNEYLTIGTTAVLHDGRGNTTDDGDFRYEYDVLNRLVSAKRKSDSAEVFRNSYDAQDHCVRTVSEDGQSTDYLFDANWRLLEERPDGQSPITYVFGAGQDEPVRRKLGATAHYFHAGKLGTVQSITDASGRTVERYRYDAYGRRLIYNNAGQQVTTSTVGNRIGYTGRFHEVGHLIDLRNRSYHTDLGCFMQRDPAAFVDGVNLYLYASASPLGRFDVVGLDDTEDAPVTTPPPDSNTTVSGDPESVDLNQNPPNPEEVQSALEAAKTIELEGGSVISSPRGAAITDQARQLLNNYLDVLSKSPPPDTSGRVESDPIQPTDFLAGAIVKGFAAPIVAQTASTEYSGVRDLSKLLREAGVSRERRLNIIQSFNEGTIQTKVAKGSENFIRYFGGEAKETGRFLTPTFPPYGDARTVLALPPGNTASTITQFNLQEGSFYFEGTVAPNFGAPGGGVQVFVPDVSNLIKP